jgi:predicted Rossmann fold nucleotide-binding protein DprA/Smf involved in DNA uptake
MKLIVAGGREFNDYELLKTEVMRFILENDGRPGDISIVSGKARGADTLGERFANEWGFPVIEMPADWNKNGKAAGPIRNEEMAKIASHCIVFWDGKSSGSGHMIRTAKKYNLKQKTVHYK